MRAPIWQICVPLLALLLPLVNGLVCPAQCKTCTETLVECPEFTLREDRNTDHLEVRCTNWNAYDFYDIDTSSAIGLRPFSQLTYINCAIPRNRSLADTLAFLAPLSNVTKLFFVNNGINKHSVPLAADLFEGLDSLRILSLKLATRHPITSPDLFVHLSQLEWLDLREYGERSLPKGLLRPLQALETLEIRQNPLLEQLPGGMLTDLPMLTKVCIFGNGLTLLERFSGTPRLAHVDLTGNKLTDLPVDMFAELPALNVLMLNKNRLAALPDRLLQGNPSLQQFDVSYQEGTALTTLPARLFAGLTQLTELNLSSIGLKALPSTLLREQRKLRVLKLSHNNLDRLSEQVLQELTALEELHVDHNQLRVIDLDTFDGQERSLRKLLLSHNNISLYEQGFEVIYVEGRAAIARQTPFRSLQRLTELDLSHNVIVKVFDDFHMFMPKLIRVNLSHNSITSLAYDELRFASDQLEQLDLSSNQILVFQFPNAEQLTNIRLPAKVVLNDNPLRCDCNVHQFVHHMRNESSSMPVSLSSFSERFAIDRLACAGPPELYGTPVRNVSPLALVCNLSPEHCPPECSCKNRPEDLTVVVDCAYRNLTAVPVLRPLTNISYQHLDLLLQGNQLEALPDAEGLTSTWNGTWQTVRLLNVSDNRLDTLVATNLPPRLELLDVSGNRLQDLDAVVARNLADRTQRNLRNISLAGNPWNCECGTDLLLFAQDNVRHIDDFRLLRCAGGQPITAATLGELCSARSHLIAAFCTAIATLGCLVALLGFFYYRYEHEVKVWLFTHNLFQWLTSEEELDRDKRYDAFVSYSHKDEAFITEHLVPTLERAPMDFRICWHVRDFMPGEMISTQITNAVEASRRTIIVLSANYLESVWGQMEFKTAYLQSIEDKRNRVIAIIYDDIGNVEELDQELRAYLKTNTYLRWGDPWFWDKLRYAMPHPRVVKGVQATNNMRMASVDKLNLLTPAPNGGVAHPDVSPPESTPPIQQVAKGSDGAENPLAKLYAPAVATPAFTISNGKLDLHVPE